MLATTAIRALYAAQHGDQQAAVRRGGVGPTIGQRFEAECPELPEADKRVIQMVRVTGPRQRVAFFLSLRRHSAGKDFMPLIETGSA